jgi:CRP-like cAMP-binding protein
VRDLMEHGADADFLLLDLERVTDLGDAAGDLLSDLAQRLAEHDRRLLFTHWRFEYADRLDRSRAALHPKSAQQSYLIFPDVDLALEWCENRLLADIIADVPGVGADRSVPVEAVDLLRSLMPEEIDALRSFLRPMAFAAGDIIVREGATDDAIYLLTRGEVSVVTPRRSGGERRVATFSAGMSFGEMAALERSPRSATIYADRDVECYVLHLDDLSRRYEAHPRIMAALLSNLAADLSRKLRNMNGAVGTLSF